MSSNLKRKNPKGGDNVELYKALHEQFGSLADTFAQISQIYARLGDLPDSSNGHSHSFPSTGAAAAPKKKVKAPVDPFAPKKPFSAYIRFCMDQRETVKIQNPNVPSQEISRLLGTLWNTLPPSDREFYDAQYREDNEVYARKLADYKAGITKTEEPQGSFDQDHEHDDGLDDSPHNDDDFDDHYNNDYRQDKHSHKSKSKSSHKSYANHSPDGYHGSGDANLIKKKKKSHHSSNSSHFH